MSMNMKEIEFSTPSYSDWQEEAVKALKGKPFEALFTKTIENITLEPLYTQQQLFEKYGEQLEKQIATIRKATKQDRFATAQQIVGDTAEAFIGNLEESLARGNEIITIDSRVSFEWDQGTLEKLADYFAEYPFKIVLQNENDALYKVFNYIQKDKQSSVEGYVICSEPLDLQNYTSVRTICANTIPQHNNGANAVQELAIALAYASEQAATFADFNDFAQHFFVQFAVDTQFFMEIAKLRAFRVLWKAFTTAYGAQNITVPLFAETSIRSYSAIDEYVNLLRAGNEALSAAIAGVDAFTIHPYDILSKPSEQSTRIARNISIITKEESHVLQVLDPAGGAYFVESLTADLVKQAWQYFLEIEASGGLTAYLPTLKQEIDSVYTERMQAVSTRKHSLIGTNIYANPNEAQQKPLNPVYKNVKRIALPFEQLRSEFSQLNPKVQILTFGELKNYKARADFVAGFLAVAGITAEVTEGFQTIEEATAFTQQTDANFVIIAAADEETKQIVPSLLENKPAQLILEVAGRFKEEQEEWQQNGLNGFIYAGQNIVQKLQQLADAVKGV